ncbi:MAG: hypothetical protein KDB68_07215 [Planctomycetes bacterium]|nr:hypothetical protein [Planctomycetota bacterium]MCA8935980.1 hypothetical protein [Planctomycetota bacterium]
MRGAFSQFVFGFVVAFSPAPFAGFGAYAYMQADKASHETPQAEVYRPAEYGAPLDYDHHDQVHVDEEITYPQDGAQYSAEPSAGSGTQYEVETDCKRRKRLKREAEQKKKRERELPDL